MKARIPGIAFAALKESSFPQDNPELWDRITTYSITLTQGRGLSVHIDLPPKGLREVRRQLNELNRRLSAMPYPVRGMEGNVQLQSIMIALARIDDVLARCVE